MTIKALTPNLAYVILIAGLAITLIPRFASGTSRRLDMNEQLDLGLPADGLANPHPMQNGGDAPILKTCTKCGVTGGLEMFSKSKRGRHGRSSACTGCLYAQQEISRKKNLEKRNEWRRAYYRKNIDRVRSYKREWYRSNLETNPEKTRQYQSKIREAPGYRIRASLKTCVHRALRGGGAKSKSTLGLVGCSVDELRSHLESLWQDGMTWDNYGAKGWHIDHIIPCAMFDLKHSEEQEVCFHWTNLQPLWAEDNISKSARWIG